MRYLLIWAWGFVAGALGTLVAIAMFTPQILEAIEWLH